MSAECRPGELEETRVGERRVALTPVSVRRLIGRANRAVVEPGVLFEFPRNDKLDARDSSPGGARR